MSTAIARFLQALENDSDLRFGNVHHEFVPPKPQVFGDIAPPLPSAVTDGLEAMGIHRLYSHQTAAISSIREGKNTVLVTPTASGKTLGFFLPIVESLFDNPEQSALLLYPLKALEQDQRGKILEWQARLRGKLPISVEIFDGDTPRSQRARIKAKPPQFVISNPDMLHQAMLAYHAGWRKFFERLRWIVVDELHAYRGVFGSHVLQVFRRFSRLLEYSNSRPQFICLSATIANPQELAEALTGRTFDVIQESGSPSGGRHIVLADTAGSTSGSAAKLLITALEQGLKAIVFTKSRVYTEVIHRIITDTRPDLARKISSYRAGFLASERREIERRLAQGELEGVISTSALELGIDIGGLDICILVGYPGSVMSFWQRAGRVGRRGEESAIVMLAGSDALDQYFLSNPPQLLGRPVEAALVNQSNEEILRAHLPAAAAEIPLMQGDPYIDVAEHGEIITDLEHEGLLVRSASGKQWFPGSLRPHSRVNLRNAGGSFDIFADDEKHPLGQISGNSIFRECHEGAIYLHCGEQYLVRELDAERKRIKVNPIQASYYTIVRSDKQTEIIDCRESKSIGSLTVHRGKVKVTETYHSYERRRIYTQELLSVEPLDFPPQSFVTSSVWVEIPSELGEELARDELHFMGGIHAVEHSAISLVPLFCLCDRNDVGGISFTRHKQLDGGAVFLYDGYPGGAGIADHVFMVIEDLLTHTLQLIESCACEEGCPSCIQSPKCGSGNKPLDKQASKAVLRWLLSGHSKDPIEKTLIAISEANRGFRSLGEDSWIPKSIPANMRVCVFDLETQRSAEEVGGWNEARQMRIAVGAVWDSQTNETIAYDETHVEELIAHLKRANLVVGFNVRRFDYEVLRGYTFEHLGQLPTLDLLNAVENTLGRRLKLDTLAQATLGQVKSADGLQSLSWFKEGRLDLVTEYCIHDVEITRDLLLFALQHGYVLYDRKDMGRVRVPLGFDLERLSRTFAETAI